METQTATLGSAERLGRHSVEARALCGTLAAQVARTTNPSCAAEPAIDWRELDWNKLARLARIHRAEQVLERAARAALVQIPPEIAAQWAHAEKLLALETGAALKTLTALWPKLEKARIRTAVFKGAVLQRQLYHSFFVRRAGDLDLLVARADFERAGEILRQEGWTLAPPCRTIWWRLFLGEQHYWNEDKQRTTIDLHYRTQQPGCPRPRYPSAFLNDLAAVRLGEIEIAALSPKHAALVAAISIVKALMHREPSLRHVADLAALTWLAGAVEARQWRRYARSQGLERTLLLGWRACERCLDYAFEAAADANFEPSIDTKLFMLVVDPQTEGLIWPRRVDLLWSLVDEKRSFPVEFALRHLSEGARAVGQIGSGAKRAHAAT